MASRPFSALRSERNALDLPVAALAGLAVAFAAFAIPADVLAELVGASGLPNLLEAAQPPLGTTARIAVAAAGSITVFAAAFLLLRWLDRFAVSPARPTLAADPKPRLRKRDAHPDAPARVPLSAIRELGEPAPPLSVRRSEPVVPEPVEPEPASSVAAPRQAESIFSVPVEPAAATAPAVEPARPESLTELMARLERGLERRARPAPSTPDAPQVFPSATDDRLQSAINSLQRLTERDA